MFTGINLEIAMNRANNSHSMIAILIHNLAIVIAVAIDFMCFCYERLCSYNSSTEFKTSIDL